MVALQTDLWTQVITKHVNVKDFRNLALACRDMHRVVDLVAERMARERYNSATSSPYPNWRSLVMDDNCRNGMYAFDIFVQSSWVYNSSWMYYTNAVRHVLWDRKDGFVHLVVEAFGNSDLRPAGTTIIEAPTINGCYRKKYSPTMSRPIQKRLGYELCMISFPEDLFTPARTYMFRYSGHSADYRAETFLAKGFDFFAERQRAMFVPRTWVPAPSDVATWPTPPLEAILKKRQAKGWGDRLEPAAWQRMLCFMYR